MSFKAARCPNCKKDIQVPDDLDNAKCMYCGSIIVVKEAVKLAGGGANIETLLELVEYEEKLVGVFQNKKANKYYLKVLEHDPKYVEAWVGKGLNTHGFEMSAIDRALVIAGDKDRVIELLNKRLLKFGLDYNETNSHLSFLYVNH
jgi:DNA-directed RNA polymerase subunit RPC12/RpoP